MKVKYFYTSKLDGWQNGEQVVAVHDGNVIFGFDFSDDSEFQIEDSRYALKEIQKALKTRKNIELIRDWSKVDEEFWLPKIHKYFNL